MSFHSLNMHTISNYVGAQRSLEGDLCVMLTIEDKDLEWLENHKDCDLVVEIKKYNPKRSLNANAYFWKLCDDIAKALGSDKDTIYLMMLRDYGVFDCIDVIEQAVPTLESIYRLCETDYTYTIEGDAGLIKMASLKCYKGSSQYDTKEMSRLIDGAVTSAHEIGISTWSDDEIKSLIERW